MLPYFVVLRKIHSFGNISFQIEHALFYALRSYEFEGDDVDYIISHPNSNPNPNLTIDNNI